MRGGIFQAVWIHRQSAKGEIKGKLG